MRTSVPSVGHFAWHFGEMCLVMCAGLAGLDAGFVGLAHLAGTSDPVAQWPVATVLVVAFNMALPMVLWMRFRGMAWQPTWEMAGAMFAEAAVVLAAYWLGLVAAGKDLFGLQHALMMPAMLVPMLARARLYATPMRSHRRARAASSAGRSPTGRATAGAR